MSAGFTRTDRVLGVLFDALAALLRGLGPVRASALGGAIGRSLGPLLPVSRVAHANLIAAFPGQDAATRRRIVRAVWDNLGRSLAELPSLDRLAITASGPGFEIFPSVEQGRAWLAEGGILVAAHLGNWEAFLTAGHLVVGSWGVIYRAPDNAAADHTLRRLRDRNSHGTVIQFRKGAVGAREVIDHIRAGKVLGLLGDQKANDGIAAPFFGRRAMTATAPAALALRFSLKLVPVRLVRLGPARFRVEIEAPLPHPDTGNRHADIAELTARLNSRIEAWVRAEPGQWLWLHRRWPKVEKG